ncbi:hypothetical protein DU504_13815 [Haloplanus salinus]|uniref:Uncharacterized protein n=1 Tax=Haloplanus salinus TaxID=1126245 RepID=A0A368NF36_9EURY|nr:hypothetical protein DU504_13815 [Haloplanus salinus]
MVITGRRPPTWDAKAYFATEETCNLELPFGESSPFRAGRMSIRFGGHHRPHPEVEARGESGSQQQTGEYRNDADRVRTEHERDGKADERAERGGDTASDEPIHGRRSHRTQNKAVGTPSTVGARPSTAVSDRNGGRTDHACRVARTQAADPFGSVRRSILKNSLT